jgi:hypothetical protein
MDFQLPVRHLLLLSSNHFELWKDLPDWILPSPLSPRRTKYRRSLDLLPNGKEKKLAF